MGNTLWGKAIANVQMGSRKKCSLGFIVSADNISDGVGTKWLDLERKGGSGGQEREKKGEKE